MEENICLEELATDYSISMDQLEQIYNEIKSPTIIPSLENVMTSLDRPYEFDDKSQKNGFTDHPIGKRLSSVFRNNIFTQFKKSLQNTKENGKLQAHLQTIKNEYTKLYDSYKNDPVRLFENLRINLLKLWKLIPQYILDEKDKQKKNTLIKNDHQIQRACILIDVIILTSFIDCYIFTDTEKGIE